MDASTPPPPPPSSSPDYLSSSFLVEGVLMLLVALAGVALNITSVFYFYNLKHQRAFHRLLLSLAVMDSLHLVRKTPPVVH